MIPFNKPYITGKEVHYIYDAVSTGKISGNGKYTKLCQDFFEEQWSFKKTLLTTSCTDALEMCALLLDIKEGDEVIVPSYTFVSSALAFVRQGARIVFADSRPDFPGIDENKIEELISEKTVAIVVVHYAGIACDMNKVQEIAKKYNLFIVEDAAQAIDSYFISEDGNRKPLGTIGHLSTFSFHETKNIQCGEGGLLGINDERFVKRAEIVWEKGTNRTEFFRGEVNKYGWVDIGSSFLPSEVCAAFLYAQLEDMQNIQNRRKQLWNRYYQNLRILEDKKLLKLPVVHKYATNNAHMFFVVCNNENERNDLIDCLSKNDIKSVFHYLPLHLSDYYKHKHDNRFLPNSIKFSETLLRLPLYVELTEQDVEKISYLIKNYYNITKAIINSDHL